jgi:hypothetical protein
MSSESRKEEMLRRLRLRKYPRRSEAQFSDENDHNPLVLEDCPKCGGVGRFCVERPGEAALGACEECGGLGTTGKVVPYYRDEEPVAEAEVDSLGWVTCPTCGWRFAVKDSAVWTGRRHKRCGQKIMMVLNSSESRA